MTSTSTPVLANLTWQEAERILATRPVGLLPIGAIEAHGPHLPLDTDVIIAEATVTAAAGLLIESGIPSIVLPPITFAVSFVGTSFAGTSPASADGFGAYLTSVLTNLAPQGYRALVVCNAHLEPAHVATIQQSCEQAEAATGIPVRFPDQRLPPYSDSLSDEFRAGARHAGSYETSIVLAARPDAVRVNSLATLQPVWIDLPARLRAGARTFLDAGSELGYFGDPARATVEEGRQMLNALAHIVLDVVTELGIE